jgi:hypothetical protein
LLLFVHWPYDSKIRYHVQVFCNGIWMVREGYCDRCKVEPPSDELSGFQFCDERHWLSYLINVFQLPLNKLIQFFLMIGIISQRRVYLSQS